MHALCPVDLIAAIDPRTISLTDIPLQHQDAACVCLLVARSYSEPSGRGVADGKLLSTPGEESQRERGGRGHFALQLLHPASIEPESKSYSTDFGRRTVLSVRPDCAAHLDDTHVQEA